MCSGFEVIVRVALCIRSQFSHTCWQLAGTLALSLNGWNPAQFASGCRKPGPDKGLRVMSLIGILLTWVLTQQRGCLDLLMGWRRRDGFKAYLWGDLLMWVWRKWKHQGQGTSLGSLLIRALITSQRPHLQLPSHWRLGYNLWIWGGHKHSVYSSEIHWTFPMWLQT